MFFSVCGGGMFSNLRREKWVYLLVALTYQSPLNQPTNFPHPISPTLYLSAFPTIPHLPSFHIFILFIFILKWGYVCKFYISFRTQCLYFYIKIKPHRIVYFLRDFVYLCMKFAIFCMSDIYIWARDGV